MVSLSRNLDASKRLRAPALNYTWLNGSPAFWKPLKPPKFCKYWRNANCWICSGENEARGLNCGSTGVVVGVTEAGPEGAWSTAWLAMLGSMLDWMTTGSSGFFSWSGSSLDPPRIFRSLAKPSGGGTRTSLGPLRSYMSWSLNSSSPTDKNAKMRGRYLFRKFLFNEWTLNCCYLLAI